LILRDWPGDFRRKRSDKTGEFEPSLLLPHMDSYC
jgi:hypothetical protein